MVLFSSFSHFNIFLLFLYLGLLCGSLFCLTNNIFAFLKTFILKLNNNRLIKLYSLNVNGKFKKLHHNIKVKLIELKCKILNCFLNIFLLLFFVAEIVLCYFINLKYNFGCFSFYYLIIWGISFYLGYVFIKMVANFLINFYNRFIKKVNLNGRK